MKKTLRILLAAVLCFALFATFAGAEGVTSVKTVYTGHKEAHHLGIFSDAPASSDWKYRGLNCAVGNGVMNGHAGLIRPDDNLTRAELATMMVRVLDSMGIKADISSYIDVVEGQWYYDYISSGVAAKIINGSGNKMMPNDPITREQTFALLVRTFLIIPKTADASAKFNDDAMVSAWAEYATNALIDAKVVLGDTRNTIRPKDNVTRAELAAMLDRIVCYFAQAGVDYNGVVIEGSVVINDPAIVLTGAIVKGDIYVVDGIGNATVDLSGVTVEGNIVIRGGDVTLPAGAEGQVVRPGDYNETPSTPVVPPVEDDDKPGEDKPKPPVGGGGGGTAAGDSFKIITGASNNGTWISYGPQETKLYATISGSTITFDLSALEGAGWRDIILHELCVVANKNVDIASDGFSEVDFDTNEEKALSDLLEEMLDSTSRAVSEMLGITTGGTTSTSMTLGNLADMVESAYIAYEGDVSADKWMQKLFDERDIDCIAYNAASFEGTIGNKTYTVKMIVPEA